MRRSSFRKLIIPILAAELTAPGFGRAATPSLKLTCAMVGSCISEGNDDNACKRFGVTNGDFTFVISDEKQEAMIVDKHMRGELPPPYQDMRTIEINFMELQDTLNAVKVPMPQVEYATKLVRATRGNPHFRRGASLRAILAITKGARMHAGLEGRDVVENVDIKTLALPSLRHRIELSDKGAKLNKTVDQMVIDLVESVNPAVKSK